MRKKLLLLIPIAIAHTFIFAQKKDPQFVDMHNHISMKNYMRGIDNPDNI